MAPRFVYYIIAILLGVDNVFIRLKLGGISYDRLLEIVLFFFFFRSFLLEFRNNSFFKNWTSFILAFALLQLIINLKLAAFGQLPFEQVYVSLFKCFSFLVFSYLFILIAKKDTKYIDALIVVQLIICIFAFLQHPLSPIASQMLEFKKLLYSTADVDKIEESIGREDVYISGGFADRFRLAGPFVSTINFSYFAVSSVFLNFYMYLRFKKKFYLIMLVILFIASVLTQTRSLLLAEVFLFFGYLFFTPGRKSSLYKFGLVVMAAFSIMGLSLVSDSLNSLNSRVLDVGASGEGDVRPMLWLTGIVTLAKYPLGVSYREALEVRREMFLEHGNLAIFVKSSHHGLINLGFHYSVLGYVLFLFLVLFLLRHIKYLEPQFRIFFRLTLIAYFIQISFHNDFILNSDYPFLAILMLIGIDRYYQDYINRDIKIDE